jgi:peptidoglycan/LPS O-acetylase OafA/YrhL
MSVAALPPGESRRIPSLDGLRAVSIAFVLCAHLSGTTGFPRLPVGLGESLAGFGVRVFFVISGLLITSLLLDETSRTGTVSLPHFYLRRTLRIFPPCYAYVLVIAAAAALGWVELRRFDLLAALTYTTNYHHDRAWYLAHTWSLAVEEQFYLLWPLLMKLMGPGRAAYVAVGTVMAAPLVRLGVLTAAPSLAPGIGETFPTVADAIATGCLLACYRPLLARPAVDGVLRGKLFWPVLALVLAVAHVPGPRFEFLIGHTLMNVGIALLIERVMRAPGTLAGRVLDTRPMVFVGALSYSLYLWQQPFLNRHADHAINVFPWNLLLVAAAALCSYHVVERPALRFRARLERRMRAAAVSRA